MKNLLLLVCFTVFSALFSIAQKDTAYIYTFGGENDEQGRDIEMTMDSGFIMVGSTSSFGAGNSDIYMVKVDSNINYQWSVAIGNQFTEFGHAVKQTSDSGYVVCGYTNSIGNGNYDAYLVRTDKKGKLLWEKTYGGFDWDFAYDVEITKDGGFLMVGETHSKGNGNADAYLIKTDKDGNLEWEKTFGGKGKDIAHALIATQDGNFAFCGENASKNPENKGDAWLVKFDGNGDTLFDRSYDFEEYTRATALKEISKTKIVLAGITNEKDKTAYDVFSICTDNENNMIWKDFYGGFVLENNFDDIASDITFYKDSIMILVGRSKSFGSQAGRYFNTYLIQINRKNGLFIQGSTFGGTKRDDFCISCLDSLYKGNLICTGSSAGFDNKYQNLQVMKTDTLSNYVEFNVHMTDSTLAPTPNQITQSRELPNSYLAYFIGDKLVISGLNKVLETKVSIIGINGQSLTSTLTRGVATTNLNCEQINLKSGVYLIEISTSNSLPSYMKVVKFN